MLKRYWFIVFAFGLMLFSSLGQAHEQNEQAQRPTTEESETAQIFPIPIPVEIVESHATADARQRAEDESKQREISDLAAQQGMHVATEAMNDATQRMANYALWSTFIVGIGTVLLMWTLWETRQANLAAQNAVTITREIGQNQTRAFVGVEKVDFNPQTGRHYFHIKNFGTSPANELEVRFRTFDNEVIDWDQLRKLPAIGITLFPGATTIFSITCGHAADEQIKVPFDISYADCYGVLRRTVSVFSSVNVDRQTKFQASEPNHAS